MSLLPFNLEDNENIFLDTRRNEDWNIHVFQGIGGKATGTGDGRGQLDKEKDVINDEAGDDNDDDDSDQDREAGAHNQCSRSHSKCLDIFTFPCFISNDKMTTTISQLWTI